MVGNLRRRLEDDVSAVEAGWLEAALRRDGPALRATCRALSPDAAEADDLLQDTLMRALLHPPADTSSPVLPWLRTVARHAAVDRHRSRRAAPPLPDEPADPRPPADPEAADAVGDALVGAVATLSTGHLAVFLLRVLLDTDAAEVARLVGTTPENVRIVTHRARAAVKEEAPVTVPAVQDFLELVTAESMSTLADLVAHAGGAAAHGAETLRTRAGREAWTRLVVAAATAAGPGSPHARWAVAAAFEAEGRGEDAAEWFGSALDAARAGGLRDLAARSLLGLARECLRRGRSERFDELVAEGPPEDPEDVRTFETTVAARQWRAGDYASAASVYSRMLAVARDDSDRAALLHDLALVQAYAGELAPARENGLAALALHEAAGDADRASATLNALGMVAQNVGALDEADGWFLRAERRAEDPALRAGPTTNLGLVALERGDVDLAASRFRAVLGAPSSVRSRAIALANLGVALHAGGRPAAALAAFADSDACPGDHAPLRAFVAAHRAAATAPDDPAAARRTLAALDGAGDAGVAGVIRVLTAWADWLAGGPAEPLDEALREAGSARRVMVRVAAGLVRRRVLVTRAGGRRVLPFVRR